MRVESQFYASHRHDLAADKRLEAFLQGIVIKGGIGIHGHENVRLGRGGKRYRVRPPLALVGLADPTDLSRTWPDPLPVMLELIVVELGAIVDNVDPLRGPRLIHKPIQAAVEQGRIFVVHWHSYHYTKTI